MIQRNPAGEYPKIHSSAFIHHTAVIVGAVSIGKNVFIGPGAVIRADEPESSIFIGDDCNVQDRVVIHALKGTFVRIDDNTSLSHGCIVHGPCKIGKNCFIGFGSVVFNAELGQRVFIKQLVVVEKVNIPQGKAIKPLQLVNNMAKAAKLKKADKSTVDFADRVIIANKMLVKGYKTAWAK